MQDVQKNEIAELRGAIAILEKRLDFYQGDTRANIRLIEAAINGVSFVHKTGLLIVAYNVSRINMQSIKLYSGNWLPKEC